MGNKPSVNADAMKFASEFDSLEKIQEFLQTPESSVLLDASKLQALKDQINTLSSGSRTTVSVASLTPGVPVNSNVRIIKAADRLLAKLTALETELKSQNKKGSLQFGGRCRNTYTKGQKKRRLQQKQQKQQTRFKRKL